MAKTITTKSRTKVKRAIIIRNSAKKLKKIEITYNRAIKRKRLRTPPRAISFSKIKKIKKTPYHYRPCSIFKLNSKLSKRYH